MKRRKGEGSRWGVEAREQEERWLGVDARGIQRKVWVEFRDQKKKIKIGICTLGAQKGEGGVIAREQEIKKKGWGLHSGTQRKV